MTAPTAISTRRLTPLLLVNLAQSLMAAVAAERVFELAKSAVVDAEARLSLAERAYAAGAGTALDVARLKQDTALAKADSKSG